MATPRTLGRDGPQVPAIGLGCFAIGGTSLRGGREHGWTGVDDAGSVRAIHAALDHGIGFFDTADVYGAGHSERILGRALKGRASAAVVASKFGKLFDEAARTRFDDSRTDVSAAYVRTALDGSLRRLGLEHIHLYQLHDGKLPVAQLPDLVAVLEALVAEGKIGAYGWSTDDPQRAAAMADLAGVAGSMKAVQLRLNVLERNDALADLCAARGIAAVCRSPMAQGLLTGKYRADSRFDAADLRGKWDLRAGRQARQLAQAEALRDHLTVGGRSMAQGALCWLLAAHAHAVPIAGFKTAAQVADIAGALAAGPLPAATIQGIETAMAAHAAE